MGRMTRCGLKVAKVELTFAWVWVLLLFCWPSALGVCPSGCACDDENYHVNCVDANLDFVPITLNPLVQKLLLKNNRIRSVESGFAFYHELTFIDLSHNHLLKISQGSFSTQTKLNELHLNNNKITTLSNLTFGGGFGSGSASGTRGLPSLIHLNLRLNFLETIAPGIFLHTRNLKELDLGENSIRELNATAFLGLDKLRILRLDRNELRRVPALFSNGTRHGPYSEAPSPYAHLVELFMGMNPINDLEKSAFTALTNLALLDLKGCNVGNVHPDAFRGLTQLKKLILSGNNLKSIPSHSFPPLRQLEILRIGRNPINTLDAYAFSSLHLLQVMEMSGAPELEAVDVATFVSNLDLEVIEISSANRLHVLPPKLFKGMSSLKNLILKENALRSVDEDLANWQSLRILRLEGNPFHCSCDLLWLRDLLALSRFKNSSFLVLCDEPRAVHERRISSLSDKDLDCVDGVLQKTLVGISIGVIFLLLALLFLLLYLFQNKIKNSWKRNCWRRGRNAGLRKSQRGSSGSAVKASELDTSTKTSFLSQSAYPYSDEEFALRTSLMSPSPQPFTGGQGPYSPHSLNPATLQRHNYPPMHTLNHPHYHHPPSFIHAHPNATLPLPHYGDRHYETPSNLGTGDLYPANLSHHYTAPMNGLNANSYPHHQPNIHYNSHQQIVKPIPVTEL